MSTKDTIKKDMDELAFNVFGTLHPHEAYELDPDRFYEFVKQLNPEITREEMVQYLEETKGIE